VADAGTVPAPPGGSGVGREGVRRRRRWIGAAVVLAVVLAVGVVALVRRATSGDGPMKLRRTVTGKVASGRLEPAGRLVLIDGGTAYFAYVANGRSWVSAFRAGRGDRPLWTVEIKLPGGSSSLSVADGVLVVISSCGQPCTSVLGLDAGTGHQLWTQQLPAAGVLGDARGHLAIRLTDGMFLSDVVGVEARTGRQVWRLDGAGGLNRLEQVPGTTHLVQYQSGRALRLIDIATGQPLVTADVSSLVAGTVPGDLSVRGDAGLLLVNRKDSASGPAGRPVGIVFSVSDLRVRWQHEGRVTALAPGRFYAGDDTGRHVLDADGHPLWTAKDEVQAALGVTSWGHLAPSSDNTFRYVSLATGRPLAADRHDMAWSEPAGVIERQRNGERGARYWYLALPSGHRSGMGRLDVDWRDCDYSHTLLACFDSRDRPGVWRYR
jgi:outer membrane protein assembly factor BamB